MNFTFSTSAPTIRETPMETEVTNILLIEDNPGDARLVEILLEDSDLTAFKTVNKVTLEEGIEAYQKEEFDLTLLDLTLPDSRGLETVERFMQACPFANVIVMTGLADKNIGLSAVKVGAQDFLVKGFEADVLSKTIRYAIERKNVLKKLADANKAKDVAEESARLKEQFIASISHEMRTPMNAIFGMSNLLEKTNLNEEQNQYIHSIKQSSEILLGVINDILEISTLQNGKMEFEYKDFDVPELMTNLVNVMQYKKEEKPLDFILNIDPSVPKHMRGDKLRLNQILFNIVGNAVKFTDEGSITITMKVAENKGDTYRIYFTVEDSGIGIPADKVDSIFETFTRIRTKDRIFEGTGLGLAIVKNLVMLQGGRVWATSVLGQGTTVHLEIPLTIAKAPQFDADAIIEKPNYEASTNRAFNLLLVEDHKMNQIVARKTLEKQFANMKLTIANHGKEAIDMLTADNSYDIILLDIQMPVMDGNETVAYIRKNMPQVTAPVLAMTAHAYISKDNIFKSYGFDDFVLKPFEPEQLFSKIHIHLNK